MCASLVIRTSMGNLAAMTRVGHSGRACVHKSRLIYLRTLAMKGDCGVILATSNECLATLDDLDRNHCRVQIGCAVSANHERESMLRRN